MGELKKRNDDLRSNLSGFLNTRVSRRELLKTGGIAGLGLATLGTVPRQAFGRPPAVIRGSSLSILQGTYFVPAAQELYKKQAQTWGKANGVKVITDFLNWPDLQPKIAAAVQAGGVDLVELWPSWNYLYKESLIDLTDLAEEVGMKGGGYEPYVLNSATRRSFGPRPATTWTRPSSAQPSATPKS